MNQLSKKAGSGKKGKNQNDEDNLDDDDSEVNVFGSDHDDFYAPELDEMLPDNDFDGEFDGEFDDDEDDEAPTTLRKDVAEAIY